MGQCHIFGKYRFSNIDVTSSGRKNFFLWLEITASTRDTYSYSKSRKYLCSFRTFDFYRFEQSKKTKTLHKLYSCISDHVMTQLIKPAQHMGDDIGVQITFLCYHEPPKGGKTAKQRSPKETKIINMAAGTETKAQQSKIIAYWQTFLMTYRSSLNSK